MNAGFFAQFINKHFNGCFARCGPKQNSRRIFVMDNDPSQTSRAALSAIDKVEAEFHRLPPRSPDLTPIESVFHVLKLRLEDDAIANKITHETFDTFRERVLRTMDTLDINIIDRTIDSMWNRISAVIERRGHRTKY